MRRSIEWMLKCCMGGVLLVAPNGYALIAVGDSLDVVEKVQPKGPSLLIGSLMANFIEECGITEFSCLAGHHEISKAIRTNFEDALRKRGIEIINSRPSSGTYYTVNATLDSVSAPAEGCNLSGSVMLKDPTRDKDKVRRFARLLRASGLLEKSQKQRREIASQCLTGAVGVLIEKINALER